MFIEAAGAISLAIWIYLLAARGGFWRMLTARPNVKSPESREWPAVVAVVPARNEAAVVGESVASLAQQRYGGQFRVVLVDDASEDGTSTAARAAAPPEILTVVNGVPLPPGWSGKLWAVSQGVREAEQDAPDYLWLTDADIVHPAESLAELVLEAQENGQDMVSWMVMLRCNSWAERSLIPAFVFFFFMLYPPSWIRSRSHRTAGAAGGCILIRRQMLERIGGIARVRGELIDDCALARAVKQEGGRISLSLSGAARSIRDYRSFSEIGRMISRTAFTQLHHSVLLMIGTAVGLALTYFVPPVLALRGNVFGLAAWSLMSVAYMPSLRFYRCSVLWAPLLPVVAAFYLGATFHSAWAYWRNAGGMWKGRAQAARRQNT